MRLEIRTDQLDRLAVELRRAGRREIGGVLVGEHRGGDEFALVDLSVQRRGGGRAHFQRDPAMAAAFVDDLIARSGGEALQVNYLGEWHSHPSFSASPSVTDVIQMGSIVDDPDELATFAVLLIVSLKREGLEMSATLFTGGGQGEPVDVDIVGEHSGDAWSIAAFDPTDEEVIVYESGAGGAPLAAGENHGRRRSRIDFTPKPWWRRWFDSLR